MTATLPHSRCAISWAVRGRSRSAGGSSPPAGRAVAERSSIRRDVVGDRLAVAGEHELELHLPGRSAARRCRSTSAWGAGPSYVGAGAPSGRASRGLEEMCAIRWSAGEQDRAALIQEDRVRGAVAGPVQHAQRAIAQLELSPSPAAASPRPREPQARKLCRDARKARDDVGGDAVAEHHALGEVVVELGLLAEVGQVAVASALERRDLGAGAPGEDRGEAEVVDVLVGDRPAARCPRSRGRARERRSSSSSALAELGPESISVSGSSSIR